MVSIHAPTGGATSGDYILVAGEWFQFTRPRGARRTASKTRPPRKVSIHAPTGGATPPENPASLCGWVSIHAPTGGATATRAVFRTRRLFQFTRPRGARHVVARGRDDFVAVSIHAPTGGATPRSMPLCRGCPFQFTRPRGARLTTIQGCFQTTRFNSRAHGGRDRLSRRVRPGPVVSIHAPTGGATRGRSAGRRVYMFQFTRPRGARLTLGAGDVGAYTFQFTRPRGARLTSTL